MLTVTFDPSRPDGVGDSSADAGTLGGLTDGSVMLVWCHLAGVILAMLPGCNVPDRSRFATPIMLCAGQACAKKAVHNGGPPVLMVHYRASCGISGPNFGV